MRLSHCSSVLCLPNGKRLGYTSYSVFAFLLEDLLKTKYITFIGCYGLI